MSDRWSTETAAVKYHKTIFQNSDSWWWLNMILFAIMSTFVKCDSKGPKRRNKKSSQNWWAKFNEGTNKYTKSRLGSRAKCTQAIWQRQKVYYERPSLDFSWTSFLLVISKFIPVWLLFKSLLTTVITPQLQTCPVSKYLLILKLWNDFCVMRTGFSATPVQFLTDLHLSISTFHSWRKCTRVVVSSVACSSFFFFNIYSIVHSEIIPQSVATYFQCSFLEQLRENIHGAHQNATVHIQFKDPCLDTLGGIQQTADAKVKCCLMRVLQVLF